jgi:Raf kinase inhibitor-like YbhB/YbcL family protein
VHWNLFNIDGTVSSVVEDVSPSNVVAKEETSGVLEGQTYAGTNDYDGPCPPPGNAHTYYFTVYALSADHPTMTGSVSLTSSEFEAQYADTIIGQAQTTGTFSSGD